MKTIKLPRPVPPSIGLSTHRAVPHSVWRGFSMVELLVVVALIVTVTAISVPTVSTIVTTSKIHGAMGELSTLFQNGRSMAVRQNTISWIRFQLNNGRLVAFVDNGPNPTGLVTASPQVVLPTTFSKVAAPTGSSPSALTASTCGSTATPDTVDDTYFNQLGIPCQYTSGTCSGGQSFAYYFNYRSGFNGNTNWAAMCVSSAGRMKAWYWTGSSWTN